MAVLFPLGTSIFFDLLKLQDSALQIVPQQESSQLGRGDYLTKDLGPSLWRGAFTTIAVPNDEAEDIQALIESLRGGTNSFYAYNVRRPFPKADPTGSIIGSNTVQINAIGSDRRSLQLKGLTAGYVLTRGDCIDFDYGLARSRAYHRVLETVTADGAGVSPSFDVEPAVRAGAAVNDIVHLKKPSVQMCMVPGSFRISSQNIFTLFAFDAFQVTTGATPVLYPDLFVDVNTFYAPTVTPALIPLTDGLFTDTNIFYAPVVTSVKPLSAGLFTDSDTFFAPTLSKTYTMSPGLFTDTNVFYSPIVTQS